MNQRNEELEAARGQIAALKAEVDKLQVTAKREAEAPPRPKRDQSLVANDQEELAKLKSQVDGLSRTIAREREERKRVQANMLALQEERQKLETELLLCHASEVE